MQSAAIGPGRKRKAPLALGALAAAALALAACPTGAAPCQKSSAHLGSPAIIGGQVYAWGAAAGEYLAYGGGRRVAAPLVQGGRALSLGGEGAVEGGILSFEIGSPGGALPHLASLFEGYGYSFGNFAISPPGARGAFLFGLEATRCDCPAGAGGCDCDCDCGCVEYCAFNCDRDIVLCNCLASGGMCNTALCGITCRCAFRCACAGECRCGPRGWLSRQGHFSGADGWGRLVSVLYEARFVYADRDAAITARGISRSTRTYENGRLVFTSRNATEDVSIALRAGWNVLLMRHETVSAPGSISETASMAASDPAHARWMLR